MYESRAGLRLLGIGQPLERRAYASLMPSRSASRVIVGIVRIRLPQFRQRRGQRRGHCRPVAAGEFLFHGRDNSLDVVIASAPAPRAAHKALARVVLLGQ